MAEFPFSATEPRFATATGGITFAIGPAADITDPIVEQVIYADEITETTYYDEDVGTYTVPEAGLYHLHARLTYGAGDTAGVTLPLTTDTRLRIVRNDADVIAVTYESTTLETLDSRDSISVDTLYPLEAGDVITVEFANASLGTVVIDPAVDYDPAHVFYGYKIAEVPQLCPCPPTTTV